MRVNQINSTTFNGQFKNSALLQKTIKYTTTEELHTFNKLLDKAKRIVFYAQTHTATTKEHPTCCN